MAEFVALSPASPPWGLGEASPLSIPLVRSGGREPLQQHPARSHVPPQVPAPPRLPRLVRGLGEAL